MSNLARTSNTGLSELESSVVKASLAPRVVNSPEVDIKNSITSGVTTALYNLGQSIKNLGERQILESKILIDLKFHFKGFTTKDIENAFELGSKGFFRSKPDEVLYLSPEKVFSWFTGYKKSVKEKTMLKHMQELANEEKRRELTPEEKQEIVIKFLKNEVVKEFYKYKTGHELSDPVNAIYDTLEKFEIINIDLPNKKRIEEQAIGILHSTLKGKDLQEFTKRTGIGRVKIKMLCKHIALKEFFDELLRMEILIEELIYNKFKLLNK